MSGNIRAMSGLSGNMRMTTKRSGLRGVKLLITAASIVVTLGGWAALASQERSLSSAVAAVSAPQPPASGQPALRNQAAPRILRRVIVPPVAITRSSR